MHIQWMQFFCLKKLHINKIIDSFMNNTIDLSNLKVLICDIVNCKNN